jgi:hypothetical protein
MADDEEVGCKVEYLDTPDGNPEETNWIKRAGRARVTYPNGCVFEGNFDAEKIKQGNGVFIWMKPGEEDEAPTERARYEGNYKDGVKSGVGKMTFPNGDIYEGEWLDNKVSLCQSHADNFNPFFRYTGRVHMFTKKLMTYIVALGVPI